ncbi:DUF2871 family protein [Schaalia suimastitidis]|uniref:DUF2871 family protein n=1 Tax=Schaalia suimastitidis TaxID=121163 RepID=UPI00041B99DE|nr:DUF2871 family protein [Schaalia suimastitidis]
MSETSVKSLRAQKTLVILASFWAALGLTSGIAFRELTRHAEYDSGVLGLTHGHTLTLGMILMLIALLLERSMLLSSRKTYLPFLVAWNVGLFLTIITLFGRGFHSVRGMDIPWVMTLVSGVGHTVLTVGLVLFFVTLFKALPAQK